MLACLYAPCQDVPATSNSGVRGVFAVLIQLEIENVELSPESVSDTDLVTRVVGEGRVAQEAGTTT